MRPPLVWFLLLGQFAIAGASAVRAQDGPEKGGHELELWTSGGYSVKGVATHTGVWTVGGRYGWVLTGPQGPGFLRGNLEYTVDVVPVFLVFQPGGAAYGVGINPIGLKWNLEPRGRIVPYADLDGGVLFTNKQVPLETSRVNFTPSAAVGIHILGKKFTWTVEARYGHISNAGITSKNPGINTVQVRIGIGRFTRPRDTGR
jgi:lipid A 3-O-deacylase